MESTLKSVTTSDTIGTFLSFGPKIDQRVFVYIIISNADKIEKRHVLTKRGIIFSASFSSKDCFKWVP